MIRNNILPPSNAGIGKKLIQNIIDRVKENLEEDEQMMIQLLAAPGKKGFYEQFGFSPTDDFINDNIGGERITGSPICLRVAMNPC